MPQAEASFIALADASAGDCHLGFCDSLKQVHNALVGFVFDLRLLHICDPEENPESPLPAPRA